MVEDKDIIVIKVGSSTLTAGTERISRGKIEELARQIETLKENFRVVLVSSGAIATARQFTKLEDWKNEIGSKQALAAIGQPKLMRFYFEVFNDFQLNIAQCLLTYRDFKSEESRRNTLNTLLALLNNGYVPIINENDTVAVDEIELGDNDKLSAKVATLVRANTLVLISDINGVYDKNPHLYPDANLITEVTDISALHQYIEEKKDTQGRGGMTSKLEAAQICINEGIDTIITNGSNPNFIVDSLSGVLPCTKFSAR